MTDGRPQPAPAALEPGWQIDPANGRNRYWDGTAWHRRRPNARGGAANPAATASLVLGIIGFALMAIPLIGWLVGGIPDLLAIVFGIVALARRGANASTAIGMALIGIGLGVVSLLAVFVGAGTVW